MSRFFTAFISLVLIILMAGCSSNMAESSKESISQTDTPIETKATEMPSESPTLTLTEPMTEAPTEQQNDASSTDPIPSEDNYQSVYHAYLEELEKQEAAIASFEELDSKGTVMFADVIGDSIPEMLYAYEAEPYRSNFRIMTFDGEKVVTAYESTWYTFIQAAILECGLYQQVDSENLYMFRYNQKASNEPQEYILYELVPDADGTFTEKELTRHEILDSIKNQTTDHWYYIEDTEVDESTYSETMNEYFSRHSDVLIATYYFIREFGDALGSEEKNLTYTYSEAVSYLNAQIENI